MSKFGHHDAGLLFQFASNPDGGEITCGQDPESTFETFEEAKAVALEDLEHWLEVLQGNIQNLKDANSLSDLPYHEQGLGDDES